MTLQVMYKPLLFPASSREIPECDNLDVALCVHFSAQSECTCCLVLNPKQDETIWVFKDQPAVMMHDHVCIASLS